MGWLVYPIYGANYRFHLELTYSVLSALREAGRAGRAQKIALVCDRANRRDDLPVETIAIGAEDLDAWTQGWRYNHAIKIRAAVLALERLGEPVCIVDTDTEFRADPGLLFERIGPESSLLHAPERLLGEMPEWRRLLERAEAAGLAGQVHGGCRMYNTGLMGAHPANAGALAEAAELALRLHELDPVFNVDQAAVPACLAARGAIRTGEDVVLHYWGPQRFTYLERIPAALKALGGAFTAEAAPRLPGVLPPACPLSSRLRARLYAAAKGLDDGGRFAYLAHLCSRSAPEPADRRIWAAVLRGELSAMPDAAGFAAAHLRGRAGTG